MMKAFVIVIVVVYFAQETDAKPHDSLDLLIRDLHRRHGDCEALAGHLDKYINWILNNVMDQLSPAFARDIVERTTGINLFDPNEMRRVVCRLTETSTLSELKAAMNELGITLHGLTMVYNYAVGTIPFHIAMLEYSKEWSPEDKHDIIYAGINVLNMLQESRLSGLDPEGTQWVVDNILGGPAGGPGRRSGRSRGAFFRRSGEFCEDLLTAINNLMTAVFEEGHYTEDDVRPTFEAVLGFDPFDEDQLRSILCDIAGVRSIQELIEVLDNSGTFDHIFSFLYNNKVSSLEWEKDYLESVLEEEDQGYNYGWQQREQEKAAVYLPVIYGLEETGLLSLENDLVEQ